MGKIEKLVVLGVLGLIVVILAVTFSPPEVEGSSPREQELAGGRRAELGDETGTNSSHTDRDRVRPEDLLVQPSKTSRGKDRDETLTEAVQPGKRTPLLSTETVLEKRQPEAAPPEGSILITMQGLEASALEDFKIYRARSGETYATLAERFYGDAQRAVLLQLYNEGQPTVVAGRPMFVPVFDVELPEDEPIQVADGDTHLVEEGESLWTIAADELGSGARWPQLHEANLDVLPDPHDLRPGMKLRIPR
jgi:hypothetical protein